VSSAFAQSALLAADAEQDNSLPFRGSTFTFNQTLSANAFSKSTQLSYNPQYLWGFSLALRWYLNQLFSLGVGQGLQIELTDSDYTTSSQQPLLTDTAFLFDARVLKARLSEHQTFNVHGQAILTAPTSIASQAATMTLGTQANAVGVFTLEDWLEGVGFGIELSYLHRFLRSNTLHADTPYPCYTGGTSWNSCQALGSITNTGDAFSFAVLSDMSVTTRLALHFVGEYGWYKAAPLAETSFTTSTGMVITLPDESLTHWRNTRYLELGVSYDLFAWLGLGFWISDLFSERGFDAKIRAPLVPADTAFGLRALFTLDELYLAISGKRTVTAAPVKP
jgi:hypothetical protein